jgi:hypothetical protein
MQTMPTSYHAPEFFYAQKRIMIHQTKNASPLHHAPEFFYAQQKDHDSSKQTMHRPCLRDES